MKRQLSVVLKDWRGEPHAIDPKTVLDACLMALAPDYRDEMIEGQEKYGRYKLFRKIESGEADLTAEELVLLKKLVGKRWPSIIVGQVYEVLEDG